MRGIFLTASPALREGRGSQRGVVKNHLFTKLKNMPEGNPENKTKLYLFTAIAMIVVISFWAINLKNSFHKINSTPTQNQNFNLDKLSANLSQLLDEFDKAKKLLAGAATSSADNLQNTPKIAPEDLAKMLEKLDQVKNSTSTAILTPTTTP
jgi:hypothetical protein